jgi:nitroimidazol reductase NimA-like FMN-containing flavoprotein (pyridoxamine 5'-phosphate oxidase superfamily)
MGDESLTMSETLLEVLNEAQCLALLGQVPVGRIGITVGALPVILPVNFAALNGSVIFRTVPGTKLSAATANHVVAFEVDSYEAEGRSGWSVLVQGMASEVTDPVAVRHSLAALGTPWGVAEVADRIVKIEVERISGRRFGIAAK